MSTSEQKAFCVPSLQKQILLLLYHERSGGHVDTQNTCTWSLENPHEVLESQRDSPKLNVFCAISWRKVYGPFVFGELKVTGSAYLDTLLPGWALSRSRSSCGTPRHFRVTAFCLRPYNHFIIRWSRNILKIRRKKIESQ
ncbi:hypothetical protein TNCV_3259401 [Trichonephila clavipes]|nr:hypothetical protein TNCV_3259401 [Trichonephila clavipes]